MNWFDIRLCNSDKALQQRFPITSDVKTVFDGKFIFVQGLHGICHYYPVDNITDFATWPMSKEEIALYTLGNDAETDAAKLVKYRGVFDEFKIPEHLRGAYKKEITEP